jgi:hypothetical protein
MDVPRLATLLKETADHHDPYERSAPPHNWWDWYAAYISSRENGHTPDESSKEAARYMEEVLHVVRQ